MASGRVTDSSSNPVSSVAVSAGAGLSATTNASGYYTLTGLISGTYTLTPTKSGYTFSPPSRTVSVPPDATGQDFVASHGLITEQDLTGDGTLDLRLDNGIMWIQVNRDTVSGVKGFVDAGGISGQSNFMTYTVSSGGMVDQVAYWQTVSFTVQILTNTTQVGAYKVTDVERANGKEVTKEYTVTLAAGREYAEVEYRFTNTGSSAWTYDETPSHIHHGADLAIMSARELTDIKAYINGVGEINLPSLTWWASYSPSSTEPFAVLYQPSNGNAMTFGFKAWDYANHQIVAYYTGASPVIEPKLELMATPFTLNPGSSARWKALIAFHTGGYTKGAQIYSGYSIAGLTPPTDLRARPGPTSITLDWIPSTSANLVGYNVYRSTAPITGFAKINSALVTGDTWADTGLA